MHPGGVHPPEVGEWLRWWTVDPLVIAVLATGGALYARGASRLHDRADASRSAIRWRAAAYYAGLATLALALLSPLDRASDVLFSAHMAQHELLMVIAAPLIVLGKPLVPALWALPRRWRVRTGRTLQRPGVVGAWRVLTSPVVALALHAAIRWMWHVPRLFDAALDHEALHAVQHLMFFGSAVLFWWALIHGRYGRVGYGVGVAFVFVTVIHSGLLAAMLALTDHPLYEHGQRTAAWGLDAVADQQEAGFVMWVPAGVIMMGIGLAIFAAWLGQASRATRGSIVVLAVVLLAAVRPARADDQSEKPKPADVVEQAEPEVIVVTGTRAPMPVLDTPTTVTVIDRAQIEHSPHALPDDLLRALPSVGAFRRSNSLTADPTAQGLNLRGVGPSAVSRALVLADGVPLVDPFGGWVYWRALSPLEIDRIEVAPGGASAVFGNFGLGGAVQIVSRPIAEPRIEAIASTGSFGTRQLALRTSARRGPIGVEVVGDVLDSDGFTPIANPGAVDHPAASTHRDAAARIEHTSGKSTERVFGRWFDESLDAGTQHQTADVTTAMFGGGWRLERDLGRLDVEAFGGMQRFRQERARVSPDRDTATTSSHQTTPSNNQGASVLFTSRALGGMGHVLVFGADVLRVAGTATDDQSPPMPSDTSVLQRSAGGEQRYAGAFVEDTAHATSRIDVTAALRIDGWQNVAGRREITLGSGEHMATTFDDRSQVQLSPRLGVLGHLSDEFALRGSVYRGFRAPTLNELYRPFQVGTVLTEANEQLRAETSWGGEFGPQLANGPLVARAAFFWTEISDPINNVTLAQPLPSGAMRQRQNLGHARVTGLELEASFRPAPAWLASVGYTFAHSKVTEADGQPMLVGKRLAQDPQQRATAALTYDSARIAAITAQVRYVDRQFEDDLNTLSMGAYALVDAVAARRIARGFSGFVSVENLFDRRYLVGRAGIDTVGPPRLVQLGLRFDSAKW